jgi:hypothetical protein
LKPSQNAYSEPGCARGYRLGGQAKEQAHATSLYKTSMVKHFDSSQAAIGSLITAAKIFTS